MEGKYLDKDGAATLVKKIESIYAKKSDIDPLKAYPIGTIYISWNYASATNTTDAYHPAHLFGGSWSPIQQGCALWTWRNSIAANAADSAHYQEAGLPNIVGKFYVGGNPTNMTTKLRGAIRDAATTTSYGEKGGDGGTDNVVHFNAAYGDSGASQSDDASLRGATSSPYGKSTTVQPPAIKIFAWRRYA